ncbi:phosphodiester glycosidase family protein [Haloferula sargassicola]|uniref:Phosphodiester glycosidase domain-containing protein n=1 Tax=Haloferula sargassicola TaxID=490096 RepID=A0ABP9UN84_9BACT
MGKGWLGAVIALVAMAAAAPEVVEKEVDGVKYRLVIAEAAAIRIVWQDGDGKALRTFPAAAGYLGGKGGKLVALMNGGIFEPGGVPSGLLVQEGKELRPVNRREGKGNFFLKPNGIFYVTETGAGVVKTEEWPVAGKVAFAVQSGPLLLRAGKVHPVFRKESTSRLHRNGVGVKPDGTVVLAISDFHSPKFPNLYEFAMLFQSLGCEDALFFDGDISRMITEGWEKAGGQAYGSFVGVVD